MPEEPVCTCISVPIRGLGLRYVKVYDPFCQWPNHKKHGTYDGPEPVYPKAAGNG
ncbi:hypothetical protein PQE18_gp63 [Arthrobacter phage DrSierra]|uniref:Uncharacterized protein n=1 Tax=Arthrobacter phage DrSierra TaxID=2704034 RepID=A0A6G6XKA3_9CAUD|nr:hypothetical protein PQE18_gp63 [Arthrobacter phage DrSierra]QIG58541.1 hypothetical protein SEA_DRSIERRA_63 [Arthrobacter phage DrSierra]